MDQSTHDPRRPAAGWPFISRATDPMKRLILIGILAAVVMVALHAVSQVIDFKLLNLSRALNADKRDSVFGLASLFAQVAVAAASVWRGRVTERHRPAWFALGALVAALVLVRGLTSFNATALAVPLVGVFGLLCWLTWRDPRAARTVVWAGFVLMAASLLLHKVGLAADASTASDFTWGYQITGIVKHGAELAGWMLLATAVLAGAIGHEAPAGRADRVIASAELESVAG
ncbi:MAG: hypothetical protein JO130_03540 [Solirubrobacterales bacterium]|nr:hypothetical protein [Solirubrobacterales bacterium]